MQRLVFSTEDVPEREQWELWRELGCRHLLSPGWERDGTSRAPFRGTMAVQQLGAVRFVDQRNEAHRVVAARAAAVRAAADVCIVEQEIAGPSRYQIGRRSLVCQPGDLLILCPEARFEEEAPGEWATRNWVIPRRQLAPLLPAGVGDSLHIARRDGVAALAATAAQALAEQADRLEPRAAEAAVDSFCRLLAVAAGVAPGAVEGGREALRAAALERARRHVDRHLAEPDLHARAGGQGGRALAAPAPPRVRAHGRELRRYLLRRRLEEVRAALARPGAGPVTDLALRWGFDSLAAFYRGFQHAYGAAPGELRAALAGAA